MDDVQLKLIYWMLVQILETLERQGEKMTNFSEGLDQLKAVAADIQANVALIPPAGGGGGGTEGAPTPEQLADFQGQIDTLRAVNSDLISRFGGAPPPQPTA